MSSPLGPTQRDASHLARRIEERSAKVRNATIQSFTQRLSAVRLAAALIFALVAHLSGDWQAWAARESTLWITDLFLLYAVLAAAVSWRWPDSARWAGYLVAFGDLSFGGLFQARLTAIGTHDMELMGLQLTTSVLLLFIVLTWLSTRLLITTSALALGWHLLLLAMSERLTAGVALINGVILLCALMVCGFRLKSRQRLEIDTAREAERELDATRERDDAVDTLARVLAALPHAVVVHRDGILISDNDLATELLNWKRGATPRVTFEREPDVPSADPLHRLGKPFNANWVRPDGKSIPVEIANVALELNDGAAVLSLVRDLRESRALENQALQAERLATLGAMASSVAHEINTPLTVVQTITQCLASPSRPASTLEERDEMLSDLSSATKQLSAIVQDLRQLARRDTDEKRPIELKAVIERAVRLTAPTVKYRAKVVSELGAAPLVLGNDTRLTQVLTNLIVNASHAIPEGKMSANQITVRLKQGGHGEAVVEVSDTGEGMSPETKARLFEPFFTTKPVGVGTGLGLTICKRIVSSLNGTIEVESELGRGTTFRILLPAATAPSAAA
jgi:two-component system, NtrC family, sensor kinase